ncbi:hypothetical protein JWG39_03850 [Desulforhopalus vacuolatus]|uniref:hypothetical protein n=1 Tax=Desulforhopalus vacuolatus TaxID=40414 RepID=UPI00196326AA|nr:hypothetical protein [Desulforhopalus vacuolatus]MBM9518947.1 hypothetical protein [Desulforhopalus vacuolatus]
MKKGIFIVFASLVLMLIVAGLAQASDPWRIVYHGNDSDIIGKHLVVRDVQLTQELISNGDIFYTYKLIVSRPSSDNGNGVALWRKFNQNVRLYYWASVVGRDPYWSIYNDNPTPQYTYEGRNDLIVIHIPIGFKPERKKIRIRVGAMIYPMWGGYDFRNFIHAYRSEYATFLKMALTESTLVGAAIGYGGGKLYDGTVNAALSRWITYYGQVIELEVYAKAVPIVNLTINQANVELRMRNLIPRLNRKIYNPDKRYHGRVKEITGKYDLRDGNRLRARSQVSYNVWTSNSDGNQPKPINPQPYSKYEICGDGIDNNGNNQIDEGCYKREIVLDDNQCDDDTIGLIIDGKYKGNTPAGNKRSFNIEGISRGKHKLEIVGVHSAGSAKGCNNKDAITYKVSVAKGMTIDGSQYKSGTIKTKQHKVYLLFIK